NPRYCSIASTRCAVDDATDRYSLTSVRRRLFRSPSSRRIRSALSTDSIGYCGLRGWGGEELSTQRILSAEAAIGPSIPELELEHLPGGVAGEPLDRLDGGRQLVRRQLAPGVVAQLPDRRRRPPGDRDDHRDRRLAPPGMRPAHHRDLGDVGV